MAKRAPKVEDPIQEAAAAPADVLSKDEQRAYHLAALAALDAPAPVLFPKWKYASGRRSEIVADAAAEAALGEGWFDSAADVPKEEEK